MLMLAIFSFLDSDFIPDARQFQLDALAQYPGSEVLRQGFFDAHPNLVRIGGVGYDYIDSDRIQKLRDIEILTLVATLDDSVVASFDLSEEVTIKAWFSLCTTLSVTLLLGILSCLFSRDAYKIMIRPIEKMKLTVQKVRKTTIILQLFCKVKTSELKFAFH